MRLKTQSKEEPLNYPVERGERGKNAVKAAELLLNDDHVSVLIFGKKLNKNGTLHERGMRTVDEAEDLIRYLNARTEAKNKAQNLQVIYTGGKSSSYKMRGLEIKSEASTMQSEMMGRGINAKNTVLEEGSYDTVGNIVNSRPLVDDFKSKTVLLVAEKPMMNRAVKIARRVFGGEYDLLEIPATVELSSAYKIFNTVKEWLAYRIFTSQFGDVKEGDIGAFKHTLRTKHPLYKDKRA